MNINELCKDVPPGIRPEIRTLAKAVKALRDKIEEQIPIYTQSPLAQTDKNAKEKALKAAPESRSAVRGYAQALGDL